MNNRIKRFLRPLFYALYYSFARHLPGSSKPYAFGSRRIRYWVCKHLFAKCGRRVNIEHGAMIGNGSGIEIGNRSNIGINCSVTKAVIGDHVIMGPDVVFISCNHKFSNPNHDGPVRGVIVADSIVVGDYAWIGTRVIVLPGRKIGKYSIVGAGSVVTKDVPDHAIVAGNPARIIRFKEKPDV